MHGFKLDSRTNGRRLLNGALIVSGCLLMAACSGKDKPGTEGESQVAAQVNDGEISVHQVEALMQMRPQMAAQMGEAAPSRLLDGLIEQELAAQAARAAGLDKSPKVLQAMALAQREVLARAYQDSLADKASLPDFKSVDSYYEDHPELFAKRRQYTLQEVLVQATPDQTRELMAKVNAATSVQQVNAAVLASGLPHSSRVNVQWAEGLPMDLLPQLASLNNGQSVGVAAPGGFVIMTVLQSQEVPITRAAAEKPIQNALMAAKRQELVRRGMDELRQKAQITRKGAFAASAAASDVSQPDAASAPSEPTAP